MAGLKKNQKAFIFAYRYSESAKTRGTFWSVSYRSRSLERGFMIFRGFYRSNAIILIGLGISRFQEEHYFYYHDTPPVKIGTFSVPVEIRIFTGNTSSFGVGISFFASLNKEHFHLGGGLSFSLGKIR